MEIKNMINDIKKDNTIEKLMNGANAFLTENVFRASSGKLKKHILSLLKKDIELKPRYISDHFAFEALLHSWVDPLEKYYKYSHLFANHSKMSKVLKNGEPNPYYFNILDCASPEHVYDAYQRIHLYQDTKKFGEKYLRSYKHLMIDPDYDDKIIPMETLNTLMLLKDKNIEPDVIRQELRKVAIFENNASLNNALEKIIDNNGLTFDKLLDKLKQDGFMDIISADEKTKIILAKPTCYDSMVSFGSNQWCIVTSEEYYEEYLFKSPDEYSVFGENQFPGSHFILWDFTENEIDAGFQIAFTLATNGQFIAAHDKHDGDILSDVKEEHKKNINSKASESSVAT
jgi:hypothetical protein